MTLRERIDVHMQSEGLEMRIANIGLAGFVIGLIAFLSLGLGGNPEIAMRVFWPMILSGAVFSGGSMIRPTIEHFR